MLSDNKQINSTLFFFPPFDLSKILFRKVYFFLLSFSRNNFLKFFVLIDLRTFFFPVCVYVCSCECVRIWRNLNFSLWTTIFDFIRKSCESWICLECTIEGGKHFKMRFILYFECLFFTFAFYLIYWYMER